MASTVRKYISRESIGADIINQHSYNNSSKSHKKLNLIPIPTSIIADATSAKFVGKGNLIRICDATKGNLVRFGLSDVTIPTLSTDETVMLDSGFSMMIATNDYIITNVALRIEICID